MATFTASAEKDSLSSNFLFYFSSFPGFVPSIEPILIILGEPNSVFVEILSKVLNKISIKKKNKITNYIDRF